MAFDYKPRDYDEMRLDDGRIVRVHDDGRVSVSTDLGPVYTLNLPRVAKAMDLMDDGRPIMVLLQDTREESR